MTLITSTLSVRFRLALSLVGAVTLLAGGLAPVAASPPAGTLTSRNSMLDVLVAGGWEKPIITVGEKIGGYTFEAIPDGISVRKRTSKTVDVYLNHETSRVPFPLQAEGSQWSPTTNTTTSGTAPGTQNDYTNSLLSRLVVNRKTAGVISGTYVVQSDANYQRFCSQSIAGRKAGFSRPILFLNEEATDFVSRNGSAYPALPATEPPNEQAGVVVAYDIWTGAYKSIYGMGRLNHENSLALRGYGSPVVLTGDDTFVSNPPNSQLYMYRANSAKQLWNDNGHLYGFRADDYTTYNDYYDFTPGSTLSIPGEFVLLDDAAAKGPQAGLETASDSNSVFEFVRVEDMAYDRENPNIVYFADTGRGSASLPPAGYGQNPSTNGRIWKMVINDTVPTQVDSLSILYDGDLVALGQVPVIHQPDNVETTEDFLYVTEDPSSSNQGVSPGRIWRIALDGPNVGDAEIVAQVNQAYDGDVTMDVDGFANAGQGYWESSGIIDVSHLFGPNTFLVTVQAHSLWVTKQAGPDNWTRTGGAWTAGPDTYPDWMDKREGGQLILIKIPE